MYKFIGFSLLAFFVLTSSCGVKKDLVEPNHTAFEQDTIKAVPNEIVFLYFKISRGIKNKPSTLEFIKKIVREGDIKLPSSTIGLKNYLTVEIYQSGKLAYSFLRKHPIYKTIEYLHKKHIPQAKYVALDVQNFVIRLQKKGGVSSQVVLYETLKGQPKTKLKTIQL